MASNYISIPIYGDYHWQSPVASAIYLPALNNVVGDARLTQDTLTLYVWNGTAWIAIATPGAAIALDGLIGDGTATGPGVAIFTLASITTPGVYTKVTVNAKGQVTSGTTLVASDIPLALPVANTTVAPQTISALNIDWSTGSMFLKTLSANSTFTFSNASPGQTIIVRLTNTASNYTVTWPTTRWQAATPPTMSPGAVSDIYTFLYTGSNYYGSYVQNMS